MTGFKVGDEGQRYEARCYYAGCEIVMGWANNEKGIEAFRESVKLHPTMHSFRVIDRQKEQES